MCNPLAGQSGSTHTHSIRELSTVTARVGGFARTTVGSETPGLIEPSDADARGGSEELPAVLSILSDTVLLMTANRAVDALPARDATEMCRSSESQNRRGGGVTLGSRVFARHHELVTLP